MIQSSHPSSNATPVVVSLDFETYYDKEYSLSKMTTQEYIHDGRFEVIGMGYEVFDPRSRLTTEAYSDTSNVCWVAGQAECELALRTLADTYPKVILVCHNAMFDYSIIAAKFPFFKPMLVCCTMSMARSLGIDQKAGASLAKLSQYLSEQGIPTPAKGTEVQNALGKRLGDFGYAELSAYANYCRTDVRICRIAFQELIKLLPRDELLWQDRVMRMHAEPTLALNRMTLEQDLIRVKTRRAEILANVAQSIGESSQSELLKRLRSNDKFAELLRSYGVEPPTKTSQTTGKQTHAFAKTDEAMQGLLEHPNPQVRAVVEARLGTKSSIEETRLEKFIALSNLPRFAIPLTVSGAHTHRLGGCLTGGTRVTVKDVFGEVRNIDLTSVHTEDLVWDGEEFVRHEGVVYCGVKEVITWDGVTGTPDHKVFTEDGRTVTLQTAKEHQLTIKGACP